MNKTAKEIITRLHMRGYDVHIVGGAVRDEIVGEIPHDIDLATDATTTELVSLFPDMHTEFVGTQFKVTMLNNIEVATYRKDIYTENGMLHVIPAKTILEDLQRRDLTINAMAINPRSGLLLDPYNGKRDLKEGIIKMVGNPATRIREDPLRIIRACRFYAKVEGLFETNTLTALQGMKQYVTFVPEERVSDEIMKAMSYDRPSLMFEAMRKIGVLKIVLPSLANCVELDGGKYHAEDVFTHCITCCDSLPKRCPSLRIAGLMHDVGKALAARKMDGNTTFYNHDRIGIGLIQHDLKRLKFPNKVTKKTVALSKLHMRHFDPVTGKKSIRKLLRELKEAQVHPNEFIRIRIADHKANLKTKNYTLSYIKSIAKRFDQELNNEEVAFSVKSLAVNGIDVMNILDIEPSPLVGDVLKALLAQVMDEPELNKRYILIDMIKEA